MRVIGKSVSTQNTLPAQSGPVYEGLPPINPGDFTLTQDEIANIKRIYPAWKDGDPLPGDLSRLVAEAKKEAQAWSREVASPVPMSTPPLKIPEAVDYRQLPREKQREIDEAFQKAQQQLHEVHRLREATIANAPPGVNEAIHTGLSNEHPSARRGAQPQAASAAPPPQAKAEQPAAASDTAARSVTGMGTVHNCPFCGWDQSKPDTIAVTNDDIRSYVAAIDLGQRFKKEYKLLGGKMMCRFRSLTPKETSLVKRQLTLEVNRDAKDGLMRLPMDIEQDSFTYRLCLALDAIQSVGQEGMSILPMEEFDLPEPASGHTKVRAYVDFLLEHVIGTDDRRNILAQAYSEFVALRAKLETNSARPDFLTMTGSPA